MTVRRRRSDRSGRSKLHSPGRPDSARREELVRFWAAIATGRSSEDAARDAGVSPPVASATLMTMLWPRPSMVFTKPRSFTGAGRGAHSGPSSSLLWNGWIGPITGGSWSPSETSRRPKPRNATTPCWSSQIWRRDSNKMASAKPGGGSDRATVRRHARPYPAAEPAKAGSVVLGQFPVSAGFHSTELLPMAA